MTSYNLINGEHACNSKDIQTYTLRDEWGFAGVVMTDWLVTGGMGTSGEKWPCASAAGNVKAGNDITMRESHRINRYVKGPGRSDASVCVKPRGAAAVSKASTGDDFEAGVRQQTRR